MNNKNFVILVCLAAALMTVAVVSSRKADHSKQVSSKSQSLFKDLPINDITRIMITSPVGTMELKRADNGWVAPGKFNYPVKFDKIKAAVIALAELKAGDQRKLNADQKNRVRMNSPLVEKLAPSSRGSLFQVYASAEEPVASLLIGSERAPTSQRPGGAPGEKYVSADEGETILLSSQYLGDLEATDAMLWLANDIMEVNSSSITNITIRVVDERPVTIYTDEKGKLTMDNLSRKEQVDEAKARAVRYTPSYLRYDDIADPELDDKTLGFDKPSIFTVATSQGEIYTITLGGSPEGSESRYARAEAKFPSALTDDKESTDRAEKDQDVAQKELEEARKRVETVNARCKGWTYLLTPAKFNTMLYTRDDLVTKKDKKD